MKKSVSCILVMSIFLSLIFAIGVSTVIKGDVNGDNEVNNKDVVIMFRYVSDLEEPGDETMYDFNDDGAVDNKDVVSLFRFVSSGEAPEELDPEIPAPTPDGYFEFTLLGDGTYEIAAKDKNNLPKDIVIPGKHDAKAVTAIAVDAFSKSDIESVVIGKNVVTVKERAFRKCQKLNSAKLPSGLHTIENEAFKDCDSLTSAVFGSPDGWDNFNSEVLADESAAAVKLKTGSYVWNRHIWGEPVTVTGLTCIQDGYYQRICSVCGITEYYSVTAAGHKYKLTTTDATCTERGYTTYTCTECGYAYNDNYTAALGHNYGSWEPVDDNEHTAVCTRCGEKKTAAHSWSGTVTEAPDCTADGIKTYTCVCGDTYTETIKATGHRHTEIRNKKDATCTESGYSGDTYCNDCGTKLSSGSAIAALGHNWNSGTVTTAATCTAAGVKTYTCARCNAEKTESIPATGHTWDIDRVNKVATCTEQGEVVYKCTKCNTTKTEATLKDPNNHDYQCTHEAWDEEVPVYATCGITRWYVYYSPYTSDDPRRYDDSLVVYAEWTARDDFEDEVNAAKSAYAAKLKEISDNGWLKRSGGFGATGETATYIAYYKTVHHNAEYACSRCGKVKP